MDLTKTAQQKIVVTGGGSGGHTVTALAVVEELVSRHPAALDQLVYVGGTLTMEGEPKGAKSVEERMARERGIQFVGIRAGKLQRRVALKTVIGLFGVIGGIIDAFRFFSKNDVAFVFSSGGYVAVPVCFAAWVHKIPVIIHEQTTRVGLSNSISAKFARRTLLGFPDAAEFFPKQKTVFVGNTIRREVLDESTWPRKIVSVLDEFKRDSKRYPVVLVVGGGQGSYRINNTVLLALRSLTSHFQMILVTGDNKVNRDYDRLEAARRKLSVEQQKRVVLKKYVTACELGALLHSVDVLVSRGGALFMAEAGTVGVPTIVIPIPWVTHNEQFHNAQVLERVGLGRIVSEGVLSPEILFQEIQRMVSRVRTGQVRVDEKTRKEIFVVDAAKRIVDELERLNVL